MQLVVLSVENQFPNEGSLVSEMLDRGLKYFHVRKPCWRLEKVRELVSSVPERFHQHLVIHYHRQLSREFNVGYHLSSKDNEPCYEELNVVSRSCHGLEDLVKEAPSSLSYQFLSPIYQSISKPSYSARFTLKDVESWIPQTPAKTMALGGMTVDRIGEVKKLGFAGVAVLGDIWLQEDPILRFQNIFEICERFK